jgi:hypothetical protein
MSAMHRTAQRLNRATTRASDRRSRAAANQETVRCEIGRGAAEIGVKPT